MFKNDNLWALDYSLLYHQVYYNTRVARVMHDDVFCIQKGVPQILQTVLFIGFSMVHALQFFSLMS